MDIFNFDGLMNRNFDRLIDLKKIVSEMERELGLEALGTHEKSVLLAVSDLENTNGKARTKDILSHKLTVGISRPSVFRALNKLEGLGDLKRGENTTGEYQLT